MNKRIISLILAFLMLSGILLTGCSSLGGEGDETLDEILVEEASNSAITLSMYVVSVEPVDEKTAQKVEDAFNKIKMLPLGYIDTHPTGETVSRVISDVDQFADGLLMGFSQLFTGVLTIIGTLAFMLSISPSITVIVVVLTPISLFVAAFIAKNTHDMFTLRAKTNAEQTAFIDETVSAEGVVTAFGIQDKRQERFDEINGRFQKCSVRAIFFLHLPTHALALLTA